MTSDPVVNYRKTEKEGNVMDPYYFEELLLSAVMGLLTALPSLLLGIASWVLSAVAIYVIARRRGLRKLWLAWVPLLNVWLLGSLSDQYQYVVRRRNTNRRKWLLGLNLMMILLYGLVIGFGISAFQPRSYGLYWEDAVVAVGFAIPLVVAAVTSAVIRFIALYDVFKSLDPDNAVLFLVLSILVSITEPFFLFFNRDKDSGMPPRRPAPAYEAPRQENWESE